MNRCVFLKAYWLSILVKIANFPLLYWRNKQ